MNQFYKTTNVILASRKWREQAPSKEFVKALKEFDNYVKEVNEKKVQQEMEKEIQNKTTKKQNISMAGHGMLNQISKRNSLTSQFKIVKILKKKKCQSDVLQKLDNYNITHSEEIQRKIDFYYTPYGVQIQAKKCMGFNDQTSQFWSLVRDFICSSDPTTIKAIGRHLNLQNPTTDYMRKLDLIDSHPNLFFGSKKISEREIEMLRVLINEERKRYKARLVRSGTPSIQMIKIKKLEIQRPKIKKKKKMVRTVQSDEILEHSSVTELSELDDLISDKTPAAAQSSEFKRMSTFMRRNSRNELVSAVNSQNLSASGKNLIKEFGESMKRLVLHRIKSEAASPVKQQSSPTKRFGSTQKISEDLVVEGQSERFQKIRLNRIPNLVKKPEQMSLQELLKSTEKFAHKKLKIKKVKLPAANPKVDINITKSQQKIPRLKLQFLQKPQDFRPGIPTTASDRQVLKPQICDTPLVRQNHMRYQEYYTNNPTKLKSRNTGFREPTKSFDYIISRQNFEEKLKKVQNLQR